MRKQRARKRRGWRKYWQLARVELAGYGVYRLNFVLWRVRSVVQLLVIYFLWWTVFASRNEVFSYSKSQILTYVLGVAVVRSFVLSSRGSEGVGPQIITGEIVNWLLRPVRYGRVVLVRSLTDKAVNLGFVVVEVSLLVVLLSPPIFIQTNWWYWVGFGVSLAGAMGLYFVLDFVLSLMSFWTPEDWWAPRFLFMIILEFLAGGLFPVDILPQGIYRVLNFLPFPYLLFFPMQVYLGRVGVGEVIRGLVVMGGWIGVIYVVRKWVWMRGLKSYAAWGR